MSTSYGTLEELYNQSRRTGQAVHGTPLSSIISNMESCETVRASFKAVCDNLNKLENRHAWFKVVKPVLKPSGPHHTRI